MSIATLFSPLRRAAAVMRETLRNEASRRLNQSPERLIARNGGFEVTGDDKIRISYGSLVSENVKWQMPKKPVPLKDAQSYNYIGRPMARIDLPAKITGQAVFGSDVKVKGMLYGAVVRPPTLEGKMLSASPGHAAGMPGVVRVVIEDGFVGVVAKTRTQAEAARGALDVKWDRGHPWQQADLEKIITAGGKGGTVIQDAGDARDILKKGKAVVAEYRTGFVSHAPLETDVAIADVKPDGCRIWMSTQSESAAAGNVAEVLGFKKPQVEVVPFYVGGGFGRKADTAEVSHVHVEAARLSRAAGAPVYVAWSRKEEMQHSFYRPITHHRFSAVLDEKGRIEAMATEQASGPSMEGSVPGFITTAMGFDFGAAVGIYNNYNIPHRYTKVWMHKLPIPTGPWRGLGISPSTFAKESFIDEMAHAAGADPLRFRLDHLGDDAIGKRLWIALEAVADKAEWGKPALAGRAKGVACCVYSGNCCDGGGGGIRGQRDGQDTRPQDHCSHRPGTCDQSQSGCRAGRRCGGNGNKLGASGRDHRKGRPAFSRELDGYPLITMKEAPEVIAVLFESGGRPRGVGEPPVRPVAPAIGNAFFALTGVRLRRMPMTAERVKEALRGHSSVS